MKPWEVDELKEWASKGPVAWNPDSETFLRIYSVVYNKDEGWIAKSNTDKYVALYNCELKDFIAYQRFPMGSEWIGDD